MPSRRNLAFAPLTLPSLLHHAAQPAHRWRSSNSGDLDKIYDAVTPNPTGSLSGPWFDMAPDEGDFTGIGGKVTHLVCRIKNLGNNTASADKVLERRTLDENLSIPRIVNI